MTDKELYQHAVEFLLSKNVTQKELNEHLTPDCDKPRDLKEVYKKICASAQNKQMSRNVIGRSIGGFENIGKVLCDFNPKEVVKEYAGNSALELLEKIEKELKPSGEIRKEKKSIWPQYCQSVIDAAYFFDRFDCVEDFYKWADFFANDYKAKAALPLMISIEVAGVGFPLACDFLKEIGYTEFGKPDVHLKDIFLKLELITKTGSTIKEDYETLKVIDRIANANNKTAYAVDKVFWLIGSGDFYRTGKKIGRQKENFFKSLKEKFDIAF